ncbi:methyltransferase regulatory domain-containing protein [Brenneria populi]|uniref:protein O-GlcNAc transferase n=1 Tax=Brenneria populi TaxID=1505588 RepID=A0ABU6JX60_9GAMM|nr:methyltransferase regulatory domain-containing protein [Brenneria populi Li et al. 2015]
MSESIYQSLDYLSPQGLQAAAWLYGVQTPSPAKARILELGCGNGANLRPFALAYPNSQAVGIDLNGGDIADGERWLARQPLPNLTLAEMDLPTLLASELGAFDYIVVRGVFSLVSGESRTALLAFCQRHLSPQGVACFGYNTYPGWKSAEVLQDALQVHLSLAKTPEAQNASARAMLIYMSLGLDNDNPLQAALREFIDQAKALSDVDLALNYYQGLNQPCYLMDFLTLANESGLAWVGDAQPYTELAEYYSDNVAQLHQTICPYEHKLLKQQYLDFAVGRKHRYSLLVARTRAAEILPVPDLARLADFHWAGNFRRYITEKDISAGHFLTDERSTFTSQDALANNLLDIMGDAWPNSVSLDQLVYNSRPPEEESPDHQAAVLKSLGFLFGKGVLGLHVCLNTSIYNRQPASSLALLPGVITDHRLYSEADAVCRYVNFWYEHRAFTLDEGESASLPFIGQKGGAPSHTDYPLMTRLRDYGLLWGCATAWRSYLQQSIAVLARDRALEYIPALLFYSTKYEDGGALLATDIASASGKVVKNGDFVSLPKNQYAQLQDLIAQGAFVQARKIAQQLVDSQPHNANAWNAMVNVCVETRDQDGALHALLQALSLNPLYWDVYEVLSTVQYHLNHMVYADNLIRKMLRVSPRRRASWQLLASIYGNKRNFSKAEKCSRKALMIEPEHQGVLNNLGHYLDGQGRQAEALEYFQKVVGINPEATHLYSNMLFTMLHVASLSPEEILLAHRRYGEVVERMVGRTSISLPLNNSKDPSRPLRIGFVSADLRDHPVTNFLEPIWRHIDRDAFSLYAYANSEIYDGKSQELHALSASWAKVCNLSDIELAQQIHRDGIDILFDLSGHTKGNRLPVFAYKPAPIQIGWIGYPGTTGLTAMDYWFCNNNFADPGILDDQFTEKLIYLPSTQIFEPVKESPEINPLPALSNGYLTFGNFNRLNKINDDVYALWAKILVALPSARMLIGAVDDLDMETEIREKMADYGVKPEQLLFQKRTSMGEYLKLHHNVDILLDTFPYSGGTTTNHAAWMGVPTLTLAGKTAASRQGVSGGKTWGLDEFIAYSPDEYVRKALGWANDLTRLSQIRAGMRKRASGNKQSRAITPATYFEEALRTAWKIYCNGEEPKSFSIKE